MAGADNRLATPHDPSSAANHAPRLHRQETLLKVEDLRVRYGRSLALDGLSIRVGPGEVVALLGANGAGKTTTLWAVSGLVPTESGRIIYRGVNTTRARGAPDRRTGYRTCAGGSPHVPRPDGTREPQAGCVCPREESFRP